VRQVRYSVAASLDGYIAGPNGEADWIVMEPTIDFGAIFNQFDTFLIGRRTFEPMARASRASTPGMKTFVFSRTLRQEDYPTVTVVAEHAAETVSALKQESGKDIWLFGGGSLFRSLLAEGLVDRVEVAVMPVLLGGGVPLLAPTDLQTKLRLTSHRIYPSGIVGLDYAVAERTGPKATRSHGAPSRDTQGPPRQTRQTRRSRTKGAGG
jgi:dihydrofolate reductase